MALYGVLADIHGNREALLAAFAELDRDPAVQLLCAGDIIGFNADPNECAELLRARCVPGVAGNHDLIGIGELGFGRCANKVVYSLKRTRRTLTPQTAAYLAALPRHRVIEGRVLLTHAGVRDVEQYVRTAHHVRQNAAYLRADFPGVQVCLFGHTHEQRVFEVDGDDVREVPTDGTVKLREDRLYFVNPGSIDAARKSDEKRAEWALLDTDRWTVEFRHVAYDHAASEGKSVAGGYRIGPFTERLYTMRKRLLARLPGGRSTGA